MYSQFSLLHATAHATLNELPTSADSPLWAFGLASQSRFYKCHVAVQFHAVSTFSRAPRGASRGPALRMVARRCVVPDSSCELYTGDVGNTSCDSNLSRAPTEYVFLSLASRYCAAVTPWLSVQRVRVGRCWCRYLLSQSRLTASIGED